MLIKDRLIIKPYYPKIPDLRMRRTANAKTAMLMRARIAFALRRLQYEHLLEHQDSANTSRDSNTKYDVAFN